MEGSIRRREQCLPGRRGAWSRGFWGIGMVLLAGLVLLVACQSQPPVIAPTGEATPVPTFTEVPSPTASDPSQQTTPEAPALLSPANGASVEGAVNLSWEWTGQLRAEQYFEVRVWLQGQPRQAVAWQKEPVLADARLAEGAYQWSVAVVREAGTGQDGSKVWEAVSQESPVWTFTRLATASGEVVPVAPTETTSGSMPISDSTSLRHGPTRQQVAKVGGMLGLGLVVGLFLVPSRPGWLRRRLRRR